MTHLHEEPPVPINLLDVVAELRQKRPEASALELDRIKLRAIAQGSQGASASLPRSRKGLLGSRRLVAVALVLGLTGGGTGVMAASGGFKAGSSSSSAAQSQYCPQQSQQPGQPKQPGPAKCGKPRTK